MITSPVRIGIIGAGFWSQFQVPAWLELPDVEIVAICDKDLAKAENIADRFGIEKPYHSAEEMMDQEKITVVDIISNVETHPHLAKEAARRGIHVICQKPMAANITQSHEMVKNCERAGVNLFVHENFRWQAPIRRVKELMNDQAIGEPFKARITYCNSFPVFENQPFLAELDQFILTDMGTHTLDVLRFLFGEVKEFYAKIQTVNSNIKGEDVANILAEMKNGMQVFVEISYASILEHERFPQTYVLVEGSKGSIYLGPDLKISLTTKDGTIHEKVTVPSYPWGDPDYALIHSSIVSTHMNLANALLGRGEAETTGDDNLKTLSLVFGCYESAKTGRIITL